MEKEEERSERMKTPSKYRKETPYLHISYKKLHVSINRTFMLNKKTTQFFSTWADLTELNITTTTTNNNNNKNDDNNNKKFNNNNNNSNKKCRKKKTPQKTTNQAKKQKRKTKKDNKKEKQQ